MVEGARLEYECAGYTAPRVRIPSSPQDGMLLIPESKTTVYV